MMSTSTIPHDPDDLPDLDPGPGLQDPRILHPSPDDVFNDPAVPSLDDPSDLPDESPQDETKPADSDGGIVDPRAKPHGPDI